MPNSHALMRLGATVAYLLVLLTPTLSAQESSGYAVNPGDILQVSVWREPDLQLQLLVRPDGGVSMPLVGDLTVEGMSIDAIRAAIADGLERFIPDPAVTVSVLEVRGNTLYVLGKVARPGPFVMSGDTDVMQALSIAGGTTTFAKLNKIMILRQENGEQVSIPFRYGDVVKGLNLEQNILLRSGDVVVVP